MVNVTCDLAPTVKVGVARVQACPALSEEEAYPVLAANYIGGGSNKFRLSLTQQQVRLWMLLQNVLVVMATKPDS